jgi:HipA-like protein
MTSGPWGKGPPHVRQVRLGRTRVGTLTHLGNDSVIFAFDPEYLENPDRPTLSLGYKSASGGLVEQTRPTRARLSPFFSNLLPEGHLREYLARRGGIHPAREFFLISLLGTDLPGAVEVVSADGSEPLADAGLPGHTPWPAPAPLLARRDSAQVLGGDGDHERPHAANRGHRRQLDREAAFDTLRGRAGE